jgi:hypothetical protein
MMIKATLKFLASHVDPGLYDRAAAYAILRRSFPALLSVPRFSNREALWNECLSLIGAGPISFIEFGVHDGYSIGYFAKRNDNPQSIFVGLDSFEGLPEHWGKLKKGTFDRGGQIPSNPDRRVTFVKGWFQNTFPELQKKVAGRECFIVHYDADLYSSTLFALSKLDNFGQTYFAIFDEFFGQEQRALFDYLRSHNATVKFIGAQFANGLPHCVFSSITPAAAR